MLSQLKTRDKKSPQSAPPLSLPPCPQFLPTGDSRTIGRKYQSHHAHGDGALDDGGDDGGDNGGDDGGDNGRMLVVSRV